MRSGLRCEGRPRKDENRWDVGYYTNIKHTIGGKILRSFPLAYLGTYFPTHASNATPYYLPLLIMLPSNLPTYLYTSFLPTHSYLPTIPTILPIRLYLLTYLSNPRL